MAEIPCHAVKSPFEAAHQLEILSETCNRSWGPGQPRGTRGLAERELVDSAAKRKGLQREDNIFYWKPSKDSEKRRAACTRPTPGLPTGLSAPSTVQMAKATGSPRHLPKKAAKFLMDGRHRHHPLQWRLSKVSGLHKEIRCPSGHRLAGLSPYSRPQFPYL